ncbi:F-box only protein 15 isoform X4 [Heliangelus exortis]|uniref:F-box only protein 15 isoform X4 n=1 Tax=Heliangelus exortis TaxID=472823 RepID=UPI003A8F94E2
MAEATMSAVGRGRALWRYGRGATPAAEVAAPPGAAAAARPPLPFTPCAVGAGRAAGRRNRSRSSDARPGECFETVNTGIKSLYLKPSLKPKRNLCIESMPSEILMKIFSYLDAASLLSVGCVNKHFYDLASDNGIWLKIYSSCFKPKRTIWKMESEQTETVSLGCAALLDREPGYWKKEYISKQIATVKTRVMQLVKPVDPYTGLPCKNKEAMKVYGLSWIIVLKDKNGKEHVVEKTNLSFKHTSLTILWYSTDWPHLNILSTLKLFGVMPLLPEKRRAPSKNGPRRRCLIAEYHLANLTESSVAVGADRLVQLFSLNPGLVIGLWKEKNEIAFVMVSLHYHQLLERSTLGSAINMSFHLKNLYWMILTQNMDCITTAYILICMVEVVPTCVEHSRASSAEKDCYVMDVTLLEETGKPFWCFSAPVNMKLSSRASSLYDYMGHIYTTDYTDSEGKVCIELVWVEETEEYFVISLVLYISTEKVNNWFGTNY